MSDIHSFPLAPLAKGLKKGIKTNHMMATLTLLDILEGLMLDLNGFLKSQNYYENYIQFGRTRF